MDGEWLPWRDAMDRALYGPEGFFVRERPAAHFRTSVHASPLFARAVADLLVRVDAALGRPSPLDFVDMAAGRAELALGVLAALPPEVAARVRVHAVERAPRPAGLDARVLWCAEPPAGARGLLFANEWLDNVPVAVAETDDAGVPRYVLVRPSDGAERLGEPVSGADAEWLARWWPLGACGPEDGCPTAAPGAPGVTGNPDDLRPGAARGTARPATTGPHVVTPPKGQLPYPDLPQSLRPGRRPQPLGGYPGSSPRPYGANPRAGRRAEIGPAREAAWTSAVSALEAGLAVAADYAHTRATRPPYGTLTGYRAGRQVPPVPDGSCDLTAHVAVDALPGTVLTQQAALRALGVSGARPPLALASTDPAAYVRALAAASEAAELTASGGLGDFAWLATAVGPWCADLLGG